MTKSIFMQRALNKAREHFRGDRSGWSLFGYAFKWLFARFRRKIAVNLTGRAPDPTFAPPSDKVLVAAKLTGGLGDHVVFARLLRDISLQADAVRFHVFCSSTGSAEWVFGKLPCVTGVFDDVFHADVRRSYDCTMHLNQLVHFDDKPLDLGKVMRLAPTFARCLAHARRTIGSWEVFRERQPTLNGAFAHHAVALGDNRYSFMHGQLGLTPGAVELDLLCDDSLAADLANRYGSWVTINNGFDANFVISSRQATKCYPTELWEQVVAGLRQRCPDVKIVQVGGKTSVPVEGTHVNLIGATSLPQVAGLLRGALLHVDIEGGLVHVAAALGVRSVVLFGPTSLSYFGYPDNVNVSSGFCGNCWGVTERWMETCPRGYGSARCMDLLEPDRVLQAVIEGIQAARRRQGTAELRRLHVLGQAG